MMTRWLTAAGIAFGLSAQAVAEPATIAELGSHTHIHGVAVDRMDEGTLLVATHHGLFRATPDGALKRISVVQDFMGFTPHPEKPGTLFASGHPAEGGNLGFIASTDNGATWRQVSPGLNGPVDFHQMTVSPTDPDTIYGAYGGLQVSRDGGASWSIAGALPSGLIDLAVSPEAAEFVYAATESGLLVSPDAGRSWKTVIENAAVSVVEPSPEGALYAFVVGRGFVRSTGGGDRFENVGAWSDEGIPLHLAFDPDASERMFVATHLGTVFQSGDGGVTWHLFGQPR